MASSADPKALSFAALNARLRDAVALVAGSQPDPNDPFRGAYVSDEQARGLAADSTPAEIDKRFAELVTRLELDPLDASVLAVCAAPEVSWRYGRLFGYLHDDLTRQLASPRLVAALLAGGDVSGQDVLARLDEGAWLRRVGALELLDEPQVTIAERSLKCADTIASHLLGGLVASSNPTGAVEVPVPAVRPVADRAIDELRGLIAHSAEVPLLIVGEDALAALAFAASRTVLAAPAARVTDLAALRSLRLRGVLARSIVALRALEELAPGEVDGLWRMLAGESSWPVLCAREGERAVADPPRALLTVRLPPSTVGERRLAWQSCAPAAGVDDVAEKFRLPVERIARAAELASVRAAARGEAVPSSSDLDEAARAVSRHGLAELAVRVERRFTWSDLVMPEKAMRALHSIAVFLRHRDQVLIDWGYGRLAGAAPGMTVLFAGESGTGKTMAAQVVAADLGLELFRIDLATVVSKYIGETEKHLDRVFSAAAGSNAILLFDEADALFGRRSEVHDAHDRYANVEVAYLLQRIERYDGAVVLTSNLRHNIDDAFMRRIDLVVEFPFPEAEDRRRLWERLLGADAPVAELDLGALANLKLSGGSIRNVVLAAALLAAADGGRITMEHIARAVSLEYDKLGRLTLAHEFAALQESNSSS